VKKLLRHKWKQTKFLVWECTICGCIKQRVPDTVHLCFYFTKEGHSLKCLPECKRIIHCDKL
jgi:hypothetical protein